MSKQNNVNPEYYTVAGRERPGKAVVKINCSRILRNRFTILGDRIGNAAL